jgi:hypothetical protein
VVNYPVENRLSKIEELLKTILVLLAPEEEVCAFCDEELDFDTEDEERQAEFDLETRIYSSGKSEELKLVYHANCNKTRIRENAIQAEQAQAAAQHKEFLRRGGFKG